MTSKTAYFYQGKQPSIALRSQSHTTFFRNETHPLAELNQASNQPTTLLILSDDNNSVLNTTAERLISYTAYGHNPLGQEKSACQGFNGQLKASVEYCYLLGQRIYNPRSVMRFNSPDTYSPFGSGGINAYAYCKGDPINYTDPSGHVPVGRAKGSLPHKQTTLHNPPRTTRRSIAQQNKMTNDEKFKFSEELIKNDTEYPNLNPATAEEVSTTFNQTDAWKRERRIQQPNKAIQLTSNETAQLRDWAVDHSMVTLDQMNAWITAHALELSPRHTLLEPSSFKPANTEKAYKTIMEKFHQTRYGY